MYRAYELDRSLLRSWSPRNLFSDMKAILAGKKIHGIQGDPNQLGGNFLVNPKRNIELAYYSTDPLDRPHIKEILRSTHRQENKVHLNIENNQKEKGGTNETV